MLVCHQDNVCENYIGSVYVAGYGDLSESGLCDFRELCRIWHLSLICLKRGLKFGINFLFYYLSSMVFVILYDRNAIL